MVKLKTGWKDLLKRLFTLLVIFLLTVNLTAWISRLIPDETFLAWSGLQGEVLYTYSVAEEANAYILLDGEAGEVTFALVGTGLHLGERYFWDSSALSRWTLSYRSLWYASVVDVETLQCRLNLNTRYNQTATNRIFCTEQNIHTMKHGQPGIIYLNMGITLEPERLAEQDLLLEKQVGDAVIFCFLAEDVRSIVTKKDFSAEEAETLALLESMVENTEIVAK